MIESKLKRIPRWKGGFVFFVIAILSPQDNYNSTALTAKSLVSPHELLPSMDGRLRVAIAYWGMTRSTRFVYETHVKNLFNVLESADIDYTVFMHTWRAEKNIIWTKQIDVPVNESEYALLNPSVFVIDSQDDFIHGPTFNLSLYWYKAEWDRAGENGEWEEQLVRNHVCALESLRRLTGLVRKATKHDLVMYVRPDVRIETPLDPNWLRDLQKANMLGNQSTITLPNYDHYEGLNDKFAIMHWRDCEKYGLRLLGMADYRKNHGFLTSERYLKYVIITSFDRIVEVPFYFSLVRPNGKPPFG